jgi:ankyrin repeat protein
MRRPVMIKTMKLGCTILAAVLALGPGLWADEIHDAAKQGNLDKVRSLVEKDPALVAAKDKGGQTPLHWAAASGNVDLVRYLLDKGAAVEAKNGRGLTPLGVAAAQGRIPAAGVLIERGADVNVRNALNMTPLIIAAEQGAVELVKTLIAARADVGVESQIGTALHRAAIRGQTETIQLLLKAGAKTEVMARGYSPLHLAAMGGHLEALSALVKGGADVNGLDKGKRTPLHRALSAVNPHVSEIALFLIGAGAEVDTADDAGETPLMTAVGEGYTEVVRELLEKGVRTDVKNRDFNQTLLHLAAIRGYGDIADLLLSRGLDANAADISGVTPVGYALLHGNVSVARSIERVLDKPQTIKLKDLSAGAVAGKAGGGQAMVWRLKTRGWAIRTKDHLFVIDQEESGRKPDFPALANGHVSVDELAGLDIFALYTCYHAEPGTLEFIHGLEDSLEHITYIHRKADQYRGGKNSVYMDGQEKKTFGGVEISAAEMDDSAFTLDYLIKADGLTIFYAGFYPEDIEAFKKEIDFLAGSGEGCDIAFLQTTDGDDHPYAAYVMEKLHPKAVLPMNPDQTVMDYKKLAEWLKEKYPGVQAGCVENPGDAHLFDRGKSSLRRSFYFSPRMGKLLHESRSRKTG